MLMSQALAECVYILYLIYSSWKPCGVLYCLDFTDKEWRFREVKWPVQRSPGE